MKNTLEQGMGSFSTPRLKARLHSRTRLISLGASRMLGWERGGRPEGDLPRLNVPRFLGESDKTFRVSPATGSGIALGVVGVERSRDLLTSNEMLSSSSSMIQLIVKPSVGMTYRSAGRGARKVEACPGREERARFFQRRPLHPHPKGL